MPVAARRVFPSHTPISGNPTSRGVMQLCTAAQAGKEWAGLSGGSGGNEGAQGFWTTNSYD